MKRRYPLRRGEAIANYPPGTTGSPNVFRYPAIKPYWRITKCTTTFSTEGRTKVTHFWSVEHETTLGITGTNFDTWREAMDYVDSKIRQSVKGRESA